MKSLCMTFSLCVEINSHKFLKNPLDDVRNHPGVEGLDRNVEWVIGLGLCRSRLLLSGHHLGQNGLEGGQVQGRSRGCGRSSSLCGGICRLGCGSGLVLHIGTKAHAVAIDFEVVVVGVVLLPLGASGAKRAIENEDLPLLGVLGDCPSGRAPAHERDVIYVLRGLGPVAGHASPTAVIGSIFGTPLRKQGVLR